MRFLARPAGVSWLVVFLGNPGPRYRGTRHNAGFMVCDKLAAARGLRVDRARFSALTCRCELAGQSVLLMKPQTFMNLSGDAVRQAQSFYKIPTDHILVVSDDVSLATGRLRVRRSGSAGGHNGLKDIIAKCGGEGFPRIKVGVGAPPGPEYELVDWVLGVFRGEDAEIMDKAALRAAQAVESVLAHGVDAAMQEYNAADKA